ncbi:type I-C CRISPR-associated endonuclease Cas1c [Fuchsiella alkaliacetigena]|uniref:type I-C CRISPR-associated endonuclease Cas1c n=1 Tax=Fuchsiella alkaliacetigena TaxID=957042 RepID=UPI00200A2F2B|nr:type I-C CRISPR-associated endonuclease Cas1c [Fuchsiella alkaliacetigena]MCK8824002.1 type I-C CRISPR-associated endonuclease Cas1c [Fuchsiella alkaliacetigena]
MTRKLENTLYVTNEEAYLRKRQDIILVFIDDEEVLRVPGLHLGGIVLLGRAGISYQALDWCARNDVTVTRLDRNGRFIGNWIGPVSGNVKLRVDQYKKLDKEEQVLGLSIDFLKGKIFNCRSNLLRSARDIDDVEKEELLRKNSSQLQKLINLLDGGESLEEIRGFEGRAAKVYFSSFNAMILDKSSSFEFTGRKKRPPRDNVNAMLSYLYVLLCHDCRSGLEGVGLDPQVGYLHAIRPGKPALALDLMEELRPILVERSVITLINREQVKEKDFNKKPGGAIEMTEECRKTIIKHYQQKKLEEVYHPVLEKKVPYGLIPHIQARFLARAIRGDIDYYPAFLYQ